MSIKTGFASVLLLAACSPIQPQSQLILTPPLLFEPSQLKMLVRMQNQACTIPGSEPEPTKASEPMPTPDPSQQSLQQLINDYCRYPEVSITQLETQLQDIQQQQSWSEDHRLFFSIMTWHLSQFRRMEEQQAAVTRKMSLTIKKLTEIETEIESDTATSIPSVPEHQ